MEQWSIQWYYSYRHQRDSLIAEIIVSCEFPLSRTSPSLRFHLYYIFNCKKKKRYNVWNWGIRHTKFRNRLMKIANWLDRRLTGIKETPLWNFEPNKTLSTSVNTEKLIRITYPCTRKSHVLYIRLDWIFLRIHVSHRVWYLKWWPQVANNWYSRPLPIVWHTHTHIHAITIFDILNWSTETCDYRVCR